MKNSFLKLAMLSLAVQGNLAGTSVLLAAQGSPAEAAHLQAPTADIHPPQRDITTHPAANVIPMDTDSQQGVALYLPVWMSAGFSAMAAVNIAHQWYGKQGTRFDWAEDEEERNHNKRRVANGLARLGLFCAAQVSPWGGSILGSVPTLLMIQPILSGTAQAMHWVWHKGKHTLQCLAHYYHHRKEDAAAAKNSPRTAWQNAQIERDRQYPAITAAIIEVDNALEYQPAAGQVPIERACKKLEEVVADKEKAGELVEEYCAARRAVFQAEKAGNKAHRTYKKHGKNRSYNHLELKVREGNARTQEAEALLELVKAQLYGRSITEAAPLQDALSKLYQFKEYWGKAYNTCKRARKQHEEAGGEKRLYNAEWRLCCIQAYLHKARAQFYRAQPYVYDALTEQNREKEQYYLREASHNQHSARYFLEMEKSANDDASRSRMSRRLDGYDVR